MRILHLIHDYHPAIGGSERIVRRLSEGLAERGHEVRVLCSNAKRPEDFVYGAPPPLPRETVEIGGVQVRRLSYRRFPATVRRLRDAFGVFWWQRRLPGYGRVKSWWAGPALRGLDREIDRFAPDLVLAGTLPFRLLREAERASRRLGVPWMALPCLHPDDAWLMDNPDAFRLLDRSSGVFVLTPYEADLLRALGVRAPTTLLGAGVDPPAPDDGGARGRCGLDDAPVVLFLGRLEERKGLPSVLRAAEGLLRENDLQVVLAGASTRYAESELPERLAEIRARLPPARRHRLRLEVDLTEREKWDWLRASDVLVQPSRVDSFGLVLLEAWSCGKPVVAARTGPQASLVRDGVDGRLVDPDDATDATSELESVLGELLAHPETLRRMGQEGRCRVEREFRWPRRIELVEATYRELVLRSARGATGTEREHEDEARTRSDRGRDRRPVVAVVVTRDHRDTIASTLSSLVEAEPAPDRIVVVDHGSTDGTVALVRREFPHVRTLGFLDNPGFAEGNHRGLRCALADPAISVHASGPAHVLLLNPDATLAAGALERMLAELDRHPDCGAVVPKTRMGFEPRLLNSAGLCVNQVGYGWDRGYLELDHGQWDTPGPVVAGSGCALLVRGEAWQRVGGFDERFHLYYEDVDLCLRIWQAGWEVRYRPEAEALHFTHASGRPEGFREGLDHRNRLLTLLKDFPVAWWVRHGLAVAVFEVRSVLAAAFRGRLAAMKLRLGAWWWNARHLLGTLARRRERGASRSAWLELLSEGHGVPEVPVALPDYREVYSATVRAEDLGPELRMGPDAAVGKPHGEVGALGLGWYAAESETVEGRIVHSRWCCGYGIVLLGRPEGPTGWKLRLTWRAARDTEVEIRIDGRLAATARAEPGPFREDVVALEGALPGVLDAPDRPAVQVELRPLRCLVPALEGTSTDSRTLGLALSRARLEPG